MRCPFMDRFVDGAKVPCAYKELGCDAVVVYHSHDEHAAICAFKPPGSTAASSSTENLTIDMDVFCCVACGVFVKPPFLTVPGYFDILLLFNLILYFVDRWICAFRSAPLGMRVWLAARNATTSSAAGAVSSRG